MSEYQFIGIDVSKDKFDVATLGGTSKVFSSSKAGFKQLETFLNQNTTHPWVCMEATGHYSEVLAEFLYEKGIPVSVVNPIQIKHFARSRMARNKNDSLDARIIAHFAERMKPRPFVPRSESQKELRELIKLLDLLKAQLVQLKNQLHSTLSKLGQAELKQAIADLENKIKTLEEKIKRFTDAAPDMNEMINLLLTVNGIGYLTATKLLAFLPQIDQFDHAKQFAAFLGVTPKQCQSGNFVGRSSLCKMGNPVLRKILYMAALVAKRFNSRFQAFVIRMQAQKRPPKVIICAIMRKLAHVIFGIMKNKTAFNPAIS